MLTKAEIPPGGEGQIEVTLSTRGRKGMLQKKITVESNDKANPKMFLTVKANVEIELGFEKSVSNLGNIQAGTAVTKKIAIVMKDAGKYKLSDVTPSSDKVTAKLLEEKKDGATSYAVEFTFQSKDIGNIVETVTVKTDHPTTKELKLMVRGYVQGNIVFEPKRVTFRMEKDKQLEKSVTVKSDKVSFSILGVEDPTNTFQTSVEEVTKGKEYKVVIKLDKELEKYFSAKLKVKTDDPDQAEILVPVTFVKSGKGRSMGAKKGKGLKGPKGMMMKPKRLNAIPKGKLDPAAGAAK